MVGQERQRTHLIWREAFDFEDEPSYWELVRDTGDHFFNVQYASIYKMGEGKWELRIPLLWIQDELRIEATMHRTLKEAKAIGLVRVRFALAEQKPYPLLTNRRS